MKNGKGADNKIMYMPIYMSIGISIGVAIGAAVDNIALCMCLGMGVGICIGATIDLVNRKRSDCKSESDDKNK